MRFGIFYEHQHPKPWREGAEQRLFQEALDQVELADQLGIVLMPPGYNAPTRTAERIATLDLVSNGRVEFGTGESASRAELEGYGVNPAERREMWREVTEQVANMLAMDPYPGFEGKYFSMPTRNIVPKPVQRLHPPIWVACSNRETIHLAAQLGIGALTFAFVDPEEAKHWVDDYYNTLKTECVPIGHAVNANIAMVTSFSVHADHDEAVKSGRDGFRFFQFALGHHYAFGKHKPGRTNIWKAFEVVKDHLPEEGGEGGIGTPHEQREHLRKFQAAGVDQTVFIQQAGNNQHEHIMDALQLFADDVMPEFKENETECVGRKEEELAPFIEEAFKRKERVAEMTDDEIPVYESYGLSIAESELDKMSQEQRQRRERMLRLAEIAVAQGADGSHGE